jgi:hypothetical protein
MGIFLMHNAWAQSAYYLIFGTVFHAALPPEARILIIESSGLGKRLDGVRRRVIGSHIRRVEACSCALALRLLGPVAGPSTSRSPAIRPAISSAVTTTSPRTIPTVADDGAVSQEVEGGEHLLQLPEPDPSASIFRSSCDRASLRSSALLWAMVHHWSLFHTLTFVSGSLFSAR